MKRFASSAIAALLLACLLSACSEGDTSSQVSSTAQESPTPQSSTAEAAWTEGEIRDLLEELLPQAVESTKLFRGDGLPYQEPEEGAVSDEDGRLFVPVDSDKYQSIADIKRYTEGAFTPEFAQQNFYADGLDGEYRRYQEIDGVLCIDLNQMGTNFGNDWQTQTLQIVSQTADTLVVKMEYQGNYEDKGEGELILKRVGDSWRLDSAI